MLTHEEIIAKLMRRPGVSGEVERIEREEGVEIARKRMKEVKHAYS